jgi:hypothetical protein
MVSQVAHRLGFADAFAYRSAADIFREHAALSGFENDGTRENRAPSCVFNGHDRHLTFSGKLRQQTVRPRA